MKHELPEKESPFEKTKFQDLIRYKPSGVYFAKFKAGGRQFRFSLKTTVISVAQVRLAEKVKEKRGMVSTPNLGRMTVGDAIETYRQHFQSNTRLKPSTMGYYAEILGFLVKSWPGIETTDISKITEAGCREWAHTISQKLSGSRYNSTLSTLRHILDIGIKSGARHNNPAREVKRMRLSPKKPTLPSKEQFKALVEEMDKAGGRDSRNCAD